MKKKFLTLPLFAALLICCLPMTAVADTDVAINEENFPDEVFRDYISREFDTVKDGVLTADEIADAKYIDLSGNSELTSLVGIKKFTSLEELNCYNFDADNLTSLDVSGMTSLKYLDCAPSGVTSLNVTGCTNLEVISCYQTGITSLDVSGCTSLSFLDCSHCPLTSLKVTGCTNLDELFCYETNITSLTVSGCANLNTLNCNGCPLTSLNVSGCTNLQRLYCYETDITSLDVSGCANLNALYCYKCPIESLNVNGCTSLLGLHCYETDITTLDVSDCTKLVSLNVSDCANLCELYCKGCPLTSLDVNGCTSLENLNISETKITSLDVSGFTKLVALDVSDCANLYELNCNGCPLTSLDVNGCTNLQGLYCYETDITSLDVSGCTSLSFLDCSHCPLTSLKVTGCTNLDGLYCSETNITSLDVSSCTSLSYLSCSSCLLTSLNIGGCTKLESLICCENNLSRIDLRGLSDLSYLDVSGNPIKNIFIGDSPSLCESYLGTYYLDSTEFARGGGSYEYVSYDYSLYVDSEDTVYGCTQRTPDPKPELPSPAMDVGDFVTRCYNVALGRDPETAGYNNYVNNLEAGKACGGQVAHNFIFSQEYINKNKSNTEFVDDLYQMFFGRARGAGEGQAWINELDAGVKDREQVFNGFVNSQEYFNLCKEYGITAGYYVSGVASSKQGGVNCFVERLYEVCLGRRSDISGQRAWASGLMAGTISGSSCVHGFLFSAEFTNKNMSDLDFVAYTYRAFFGREADASGLKTWMDVLGNGGTREDVFNGFVNSQEFKNLCSSYGINP